MVIDLSDKTQQQRKLASRQRRAQAATRQQDMAVDRGAFTVKSEEGLRVGTPEDPTGSQYVYGILRIIGDLIGEGQIDWEGLWNLIGDGKIIGDVDLEGILTLLNNLIVRTPGKITVEGGDSPATIENGKVSFGTGGALQADTSIGGAKLTAGDAVVNVGAVASIRKGDSSVIVGALGVDINPAGDGDINMLGTVRMPEDVYATGIVPAPVGATTIPLVVDASTGRVYLG